MAITRTENGAIIIDTNAEELIRELIKDPTAMVMFVEKAEMGLIKLYEAMRDELAFKARIAGLNADDDAYTMVASLQERIDLLDKPPRGFEDRHYTPSRSNAN